MNLLSLSLRLYDACKVRLERTESKACPGITTRRAGEFPKATRLGLACVQAALTLQRKGKGGDGEQVQGCLACFSGATWQILPASGCAQDGAGVKS